MSDTLTEAVVGRGFRSRLTAQTGFWVSAAIITVFVLMALVPWLFVAPSPGPDDPLECVRTAEDGSSRQNLPPSSDHWFGTNSRGCDMYAQVIYGARTSIAVAVVAITVETLLGVVLGGIAGFRGGWLDGIISRLTDIMFGFPILVGTIVLLTLLGDQRSVFTVALVLGLFGWPVTARVFRSAVRQVRAEPYIDAATSIGSPWHRTLLRHAGPNAIGDVIILATIGVGVLITAESALAFIGLGVTGDAISWGALLDAGQRRLETSPYLVFFPALFISVLVVAFIVMGDVLRKALRPETESVR